MHEAVGGKEPFASVKDDDIESTKDARGKVSHVGGGTKQEEIKTR